MKKTLHLHKSAIPGGPLGHVSRSIPREACTEGLELCEVGYEPAPAPASPRPGRRGSAGKGKGARAAFGAPQVFLGTAVSDCAVNPGLCWKPVPISLIKTPYFTNKPVFIHYFCSEGILAPDGWVPPSPRSAGPKPAGPGTQSEAGFTQPWRVSPSCSSSIPCGISWRGRRRGGRSGPHLMAGWLFPSFCSHSTPLEPSLPAHLCVLGLGAAWELRARNAQAGRDTPKTPWLQGRIPTRHPQPSPRSEGIQSAPSAELEKAAPGPGRGQEEQELGSRG